MADFYARAESHKVVEESLAQLKKIAAQGDGAGVKEIDRTSHGIGVTANEPHMQGMSPRRRHPEMKRQPKSR